MVVSHHVVATSLLTEPSFQPHTLWNTKHFISLYVKCLYCVLSSFLHSPPNPHPKSVNQYVYVLRNPVKQKKTSLQHKPFSGAKWFLLYHCVTLSNCWFSLGNRHGMMPIGISAVSRLHIGGEVVFFWPLSSFEDVFIFSVPQRTFIATLCVLPTTILAFEFDGHLALVDGVSCPQISSAHTWAHSCFFEQLPGL